MIKFLKSPLSYVMAIFFVILLAIFLYFQSNVSFNSQPSDYWSARRLAATIARSANCSNFEYLDEKQDYAIFSCQTGDNPKNALYFNIWTFYDIETKNKKASEFSLSKDWGLFKSGSFYIVLESIQDGHINKVEDYIAFPGDMFISLEKN